MALVACGWLCRPQAESFHDAKNVVVNQGHTTNSTTNVQRHGSNFLAGNLAGNEVQVNGGRTVSGVQTGIAGHADAAAKAVPPTAPIPTWPRHRQTTSDCPTCNTQVVAPGQSAYEFVKRGGVLVTTRSAAEAAAQARSSALPVRSSLEANGNNGVSVNDRIDMGFQYDPKAWRDGVLEIANRTTGDVTVSFFGKEVSKCTIDGRPVVEGQEYQVTGMVQVQGTAPIGIHVRTTGGVDPKPAGNG